MAERQYHGIWLEEQLQSIRGWKKYEKYTHPFDLFDTQLDLFDQIKQNVQCKCIGKSNSIEMGDLFRNSKKEQDFVLAIILYDKLIEIDKRKKIPSKIVNYVEVEIDHEKWNEQWVLPKHVLHSWQDWIKNKVKNDREYDSQWRIECEQRIQEWDFYNKSQNSVVKPRFKRDHKTQRRIQCAVNAKELDTFIDSVKKEGSFVYYGEEEIKKINSKIDATKKTAEENNPRSILHEERNSSKDSSSYGSEIQLSLF